MGTNYTVDEDGNVLLGDPDDLPEEVPKDIDPEDIGVIKVEAHDWLHADPDEEEQFTFEDSVEEIHADARELKEDSEVFREMAHDVLADLLAERAPDRSVDAATDGSADTDDPSAPIEERTDALLAEYTAGRDIGLWDTDRYYHFDDWAHERVPRSIADDQANGE
jgi:hypothetical protein